MAKPTRTGIGGAGIFAAVRDLWALYAGTQVSGSAFADDGTLAVLTTDANEIAAAVDVNGNACSTTTPVGTTTYTSGIFLTQGFARVIGTCFSNANGTVYVDQSSDGQNWDASTSTAVTGGTGASFSVEVIAPFARVRFVPGASTSTLRLFPFLRRI